MDMILEFFDMGGHGSYIWPAYAVTAVSLVGLLWMTLHGYKTNAAALDRLEASKENGK